MSRPPLTPDELARLARLARVGLGQDEVRTFGEDVSGILDHAESMVTGEAGEDALPAGAGEEPPLIFREDAVREWSGRVLENLREGHVVVARLL